MRGLSKVLVRALRIGPEVFFESGSVNTKAVALAGIRKTLFSV